MKLLQERSARRNVRRRDGRVAEGARLESVFTRKGNVGSNPTLSASYLTESTTFSFRADVHWRPLRRDRLPYYPPMRFPHRVHDSSTIGIQRGLDRCVPHVPPCAARNEG
jgi:hypothetical protein